MKEFITIGIIALFLISGISAVGIPLNEGKQSNQINDVIRSSELKIKEEEGFSTVIIDEATTYMNNPGEPYLPVITRTYRLPFGSIVQDLDVIVSNVKEKVVENKIGYARNPVTRNPVQISRETKINDIVYNSDEYYPDVWHRYNIGVGLENNKRVVFVSVTMYPVRYNPIKNTLMYSDNIDLKISYKTPESKINDDSTYDLLIITPFMFKKYVTDLVEHKENHDIDTKLVTTESIYLNKLLQGRDKAEKIKLYLEEAVSEWNIKYVLLVGGMRGQRFWSWHVPVRYSNLDDASNFETEYISDLYYADLYKYDETDGVIFEDWDSNGNDIFAEWNNDSKDVIDMYPDVYVGRLPVRYYFQVEDAINRIINYENNVFGKPWFKNMAVVAGDSFNDVEHNTSTDYIEGQVETDYALSFMPTFNHTRIYVEGGDVTFTTENAEEELSKGHGFVYFSGHGSPKSWATHPHNDFDTWIRFDIPNIKKLDNGEKLPVLVVGGCHNCQFDASLLNILKKGINAFLYGEMVPKSWGWVFSSLPDGGSIASIGNTGLGYGTIGDGPDPPDEVPQSEPDGIPDCIQYMGGWIEPHFFYAYNNLSKNIIGDAHSTCLIDYLNNFTIYWEMDWEQHENWPTLVDVKTVQQWVLLGDPTLKIGGYPPIS